MAVIVSRGGSETFRLEPRGIPRETFLQEYVRDHPEVLPLDEIREDTRLCVIAREFSTGSGPIDVLALDGDGNIYIIETKLYKNPDKRTVVAQALDYGAALWRQYASGMEFVQDLRSSVRRGGVEDGLEDQLVEALRVDEEGVVELLDLVGENLEHGSIRFVVLMDQMDDRLKDLIAYVNENSRFSIYGVELDFFKQDDLEIVVPRIYGTEVKKEVEGRGRSSKQWDEDSYFHDAEKRLQNRQLEALRKLYEYCKGTADSIDWGSGTEYGSFNPKYNKLSESKSLLTARSNGRLSLNFRWLFENEDNRPFIHQVGSRLQDNAGLVLPEDYPEKYPNFDVDSWAPQVDELIDALEESLSTVQDHS